MFALLGHDDFKDAARAVKNFITHQTKILRVVLRVFIVKIRVGVAP